MPAAEFPIIDVPRDDDLPHAEECLRHFVRRTVQALGIVTPSWLWDYFRLAPPDGQTRGKRALALALLDDLEARRCAESLGISVLGTAGLVLLAKRKGTVELAAPLLRELISAGMYFSERTLGELLRRAGELAAG